MKGFYGLLKGAVSHTSISSALPPPKNAMLPNCHCLPATPQEPEKVEPKVSAPAVEKEEQAPEASASTETKSEVAPEVPSLAAPEALEGLSLST